MSSLEQMRARLFSICAHYNINVNIIGFIVEEHQFNYIDTCLKIIESNHVEELYENYSHLANQPMR